MVCVVPLSTRGLHAARIRLLDVRAADIHRDR